MAVNIDAAKIVNKVYWKSDLASLKKLHVEAKKLQNVFGKMGLQDNLKASLDATRKLAAEQKKMDLANQKRESDARKKSTQEKKKAVAEDKKISAVGTRQQQAQAEKAARKSAKKAGGEKRKLDRSNREVDAERLKSQKRPDESILNTKTKQEELSEKQKAKEDARQQRQRREDDLAAQRRASRRDRMQIRSGEVSGTLGRLDRLDPRALDSYRRQLQSLNSQFHTGRISLARYNSGTRELIRSAREQAASVQTVTGAYRDLHSKLLLVGVAGLAIKSVFETGKKFQQMEVMASTAFGEDAAEQMRYVDITAQKMGYTMLDLTKNYSKFAYGAKAAGFSQEQVRKGFEAITATSRVWGMTQHDTNLVFLAFQQMIAKQKIQAQELKQQLGEKMFDAISVAAEAAGLKINEFHDAMKEGKLGVPVIIKMFDIMTRNSAPHLAKALNTVDAQQNRLIDTWQKWLNIVFKSGFGEAATRVMAFFKMFLQFSQPVAAFLGGFAKGLTEVVFWLGAPIALFLDWMIALGLIDKEIMKWSDNVLNTFALIGEVIATVFGFVLLTYVGGAIKKLGGLAGALLRILGLMKNIKNFGAPTTTATAGARGASAGAKILGAGLLGAGAGAASSRLGLGVALRALMLNPVVGMSSMLSGSTPRGGDTFVGPTNPSDIRTWDPKRQHYFMRDFNRSMPDVKDLTGAYKTSYTDYIAAGYMNTMQSFKQPQPVKGEITISVKEDEFSKMIDVKINNLAEDVATLSLNK